MRPRSRKHRPLRYRGARIGRGADPDPSLAPWWRRAVAYTVDSLLLIGVTEGAYAAIEGSSYLGRHVGEHERLTWLPILLVVATLYYAVVMRASDGQTLGKWLLGIRVARTDGKPMSATRAIWRQVVLLILLGDAGTALGPVASAVVSGAFFLDYAWPLWDGENRAIHDMLAATRVRMARVSVVEDGPRARSASA